MIGNRTVGVLCLGSTKSGKFFIRNSISYKKEIVVFNMPDLGNFIQDFHKNYPQSNIKLRHFLKVQIWNIKNILNSVWSEY